MISAAVAKVLGALFKIPLTNRLGGIGMGYFGCAYGLFLPIYAVSATGLSAAVAKLTAEEAARGCFGSVRRIRNTARLLFFGFGAALTLIIIFAAKPFAIYTTGDMSSWYAILMIAPSALFGCMSAVERGYYEGLQNMYPTAMSQAVEAIIKVICGLWLSGFVLEHEKEVLFYFPNGTDILSVAAAAAILGVTVSTAAGWLYFFFRNLSGDGIRKDFICNEKVDSRRHISKKLMLTMLPITLGSVGATLTSVIDLCTVMRCLDFSQEHRGTELVKRFGDMASDNAFPAFVYGAFTGMALTVFNLVPSVTNMFGRSALPCAARAFARGKKQALCEQVRSVLLAAGLIAIPSGLGLVLLSEPIMLTLYSGHTDETFIASRALSALAPGMVCLCLVSPLFSIMQGIGRADLPVKLMLSGVVVKLIGNLLLIPIPAFAATGASISTSVCYLLMFMIAVITLRRELGGSLGLIRTILPVVYASAMSGAAVYLLRSLLRSYGTVVQLAGCILGAVLMYALVLWLMGNSRQNILEKLSLRM
jgi:stage V sporulation protein B